MTTAEQQLSRLLDAAAPTGIGVDLDDVASTVRRRRRVRETGVAVSTVLATVAAVVAIAVATPRVPAPPTADLADAVPWTDAPASPYVAPGQAARTTDAPPCTAADLAATADVAATAGPQDGVGGRVVHYVDLKNTSASTCLLQGYPQVQAVGDGLPDVEATQGTVVPGAGAADMRPGEVTTLAIETTTECQALASGPVSGPWPRLRLTLPDGGGTVEVDVPDGVDAFCGLATSEFSGPTPTTPAAMDPLASLVATLEVPATLAPAEPLTYVVRLTNPTDEAIALDRCPSYVETLAGTQTTRESYALACGAVGEIGPHASVRFAMRFVSADARGRLATESDRTPSAPLSIRWAMVAPFDVSATAGLTPVDATRTEAPASAVTATGVLELVGGPRVVDGTGTDTPAEGTRAR